MAGESLQAALESTPASPAPLVGDAARVPLGRALALYLLVGYLAVNLNVGRLLGLGSLEGVGQVAFALAALVSYAAIYLLPAAVVAGGGWLLLGPRRRTARPWRVALTLATALLVAAVQVLLVVDVAVFRIFGFHLNGFVWNVLLTPGGIESMGGDAATKLHVAITLGTVVLGQLGLAAVVFPLAGSRSGVALAGWATRRRSLLFAVGLVLCGVGERIAYGVTALGGHGPLQVTAGSLPLYLPCTFGHFARRHGLVDGDDDEGPRMREVRSVSYPRRPLELAAERPRWNVLWLVSESLRGDMLDAEVMPRTLAFAKESQWFRNHFSGGNGTRMGMFTMFYGLYGPYWFPFLGARRGPVLIDLLQQDGYRFSLHTSARFSYPEFDQTLWAAVPRQFMHELEVPEAWARDRAHIDQILQFIDEPDPRPFFSFMFFEAPHARYQFPPEAVIRPDYLDEFDYTVYDDPQRLQQEIGRIENRYVNACHFLDGEIGRVIEHLRARGLLERTLVVVTGDHGEEFLERGRWGHNSAFVREQIRPPLVLHIPGRTPGEHQELSSHLDIPVTVLRALGVKNPVEDFAQGIDLLGGGPPRDYVVLADWNTVVVSTGDARVTFPLGAAGVQHRALIRDDGAKGDPSDFYAEHRQALLDVATGLRAFAR